MKLNHAKMLALGDIAFRVDSDFLCCLGSRHGKDYVRQNILEGTWDISDRESLLQVLNRFEENGASGHYRNAIGSDNNNLFIDRFIEKHRHRLAGRDLRAFDLGRCICVARYAQHVGLLSEQELWKQIQPYCEMLFKLYQSWQEFSDHYLLGALYWFENALPEYEAAIEFLCHNNKSPWQQLPWGPLTSFCSDSDTDNTYIFSSYIVNEKGPPLFPEQIVTQYFERYLADQSGNANDYFNFGLYQLEVLDKERSALECFLLATEANKHFSQAYEQAYKLLWGSDREDELPQLMRTWIENCPAFPIAHHCYAHWQAYDLDNYKLADLHYMTAISLYRDYAGIYVQYGDFLRDRVKDNSKAAIMYNKALKIEPENEKAKEQLRSLEA